MFWNVIKHFIDAATLDKIAFCTGKEGASLLERDFDTNTSERQAGGRLSLRKYCSREFLFDTPHHCTFDEKESS
jgi:ribosomal protein L33